MTVVRHIALFLALAIATIAVSLTPSTAQAHDGHRHAATSTLQHTSPATLAIAQRDAATTTIRAEVRVDCAGPCCSGGGHHGSCCCATGLAPAAMAPALPPMASGRSLAREHASRDGIVPEALPEPPRPFA